MRFERDQLRSDYCLLFRRHQELNDLIARAESGLLTEELPCSVSLLAEQCAVLGRYLKILETRAMIEGAEL